MPKVAISARASLPGQSVELTLDEKKFTLFLPEKAVKSAKVELTLHFHSAIWHALQEHIDRGATGPVIAFYPGEGSGIYQRSFASPSTLEGLIDRTLDVLREKGWPSESEVVSLSLTSFSAGFGAVRELVKQPKAFALLKRVILADSLYGSLAPSLEGANLRVPLPEHIVVWKPLAEAAIRGEKTFVITVSQVPTETYASSSEVAGALVQLVGGDFTDLSRDALTATKDPDFPLLRRFDRGRFHVWSYGGNDGQAHMTHARHLADIWKALDKAGAP